MWHARLSVASCGAPRTRSAMLHEAVPVVLLKSKSPPWLLLTISLLRRPPRLSAAFRYLSLYLGTCRWLPPDVLQYLPGNQSHARYQQLQRSWRSNVKSFDLDF